MDVTPFVVTSNTTDALLYMDDISTVTIYSHDEESHQTNYSMTHRHNIIDYQF